MSVLRFILAFWRGYINLQGWAFMAYAIIIVVSGNLFTVYGLALGGALAIFLLLYLLDKWLKKYE